MDTPPSQNRRRRRRSLGVIAAATVVSAVVAGPSPQPVRETASAEVQPQLVPWYQRPVTVGTWFGLSKHNDIGVTAEVSASGRWVVFDAVNPSWDDTIAPGAPPTTRIYLRDRWTDTTIRVAAAVANPMVTAMSPDGNLIAGLGRSWGDSTFDTTWFYRRDTGETIQVRDADGGARPMLRAINNDGYFLTGLHPQSTYDGSLTRIGRLLPDGTTTSPAVTAHGDVAFGAVTSSLDHAIGVRYREVSPGVSDYDPTLVNLATGEAISYLGTIGRPAGDTTYLDKNSFGISPSGRYVAMNWWVPGGGPLLLRLWDTQSGTVHDAPLTGRAATNNADIRAVLDDGRIIATTSDWRMLLVDPVAGTSRILSTTFEGKDEPWTFPSFTTNFGQVATDINRVLLCSGGALAPFDQNSTYDCYLMPFPPSPLAPPQN